MLTLTFARLGIETGLSSFICLLASVKVTYSAGLFFFLYYYYYYLNLAVFHKVIIALAVNLCEGEKTVVSVDPPHDLLCPPTASCTIVNLLTF